MKYLFLLLALCVAACSGEAEPPLAISDVVVKKPMPGMRMSAGYFTLTNNSQEPIVITHVTSPQFGSVELHESVIEDGVARMVALDELALQPGTTAEFAPGGKHLMLMRPGDDLATVTLEFHAGDTVVLRVSVTPTG
jgi:copper(I)-binding protein